MTMTKNWTGKDAGVRKPMTGETQLSAAEVAHGLRDGTFSGPRGVYAVKTGSVAKVLTNPRKPKPPRRGGRTTDLPARILEVLKDAGDQGVENAELVRLFGANRSVINHHTKTLRLQGKVHTYTTSTGYENRHFHGDVSVEKAVATMEELAIKRAAERKSRAYASKNKWRREDRLRKKAEAGITDAEARAAIRQELAEARKLAADLSALEAKEAAQKAKTKAGAAIKRETQAINRAADKYRGVNAPSTVPMPQPRPKAAPIAIPEHLIQRCPAMKLPHERLEARGVIPKTIGQYDEKHISPWVKAMGVAA
jgi:hypothetical protein